MKICLINNLYKPYNKGGAEQILDLLFLNFQKKGHHCFVISTNPQKKEKKEDNYLLKSKYYNLEKIPVFFRLFWHIYDMFDFYTAWQVQKIIKKENPDIVITNNLKGISFLIPFVLAKSKKKHFHILHDIQLLHPSGLMYFGKEKILNSFFAKIYIKINVYLFSKTTVLISPSKWLLDLHQKNGFFKNINTKIIPNPVIFDKNISEKNLISHKKIDEKFTFLFVGQIEEHKGILFLLRFFKKYLKNNYGNVYLNIIGDGKLFDKCKKDFLEFENIKFFGKLENKKVKKEMQKANCLILPSFCYENSPTVIYEAFCNNLPVVASNIGGIPELVTYFENGLLFDPLDENSLAEKIEYLIKNYQNFLCDRKDWLKKINNIEIDNYLEKIL